MMAGLFVLYLVAITLIFFAKKRAACIVIGVNILLSLLMLLHHATDVLNLRF